MTSDRARRGLTAAFFSLAVIAALVALPAPSALSEDAKVDFVKQVKPILEQACVKCHGANKPKAGYRLDVKDGAMKGGEAIAGQKKQAVVPGKSKESAVFLFIEATKQDQKTKIIPMPPKKEKRRLSPAEVALLKRWVEQGAAWPDGETLKSPDGR